MLNTNQLNTNRLNNVFINLGDAATAATGRVIFNGFSLDNGSSLRLINAGTDSFTSREVNVVNAARGNGQLIRSIYERTKTLTFRVGLKVGDKAAAHALLDTISANVMTTEAKDLELNIDGVETRVYKAVLINGDTLVNRLKNPRNRAYIDFDFRCYTPFARAVDTTEQFTENFTSSTRDSIFENTGTAPTFTNLIFFINSASNLTQIQVENLTTGQTLQINATTTFNAGQVLIVDGDALTIELDGSTTGVDYDGSFLKLDPGRNTLRYTITSTSHDLNISESTKFSFYRGG
jgi:hypothetical protein